MNNGQIDQLKELIAKYQSIGIAIKKTPNVDEMAAALSLYLSLQSLNKAVTIASPSDPLVEVSTLVGIDNVKTQFEGGGKDLVVSFPYQDGEIEKVSYTLEEGYLNIIVKAGEQGLSFDEKDVEYKRGGEGGTLELLFVIGTSRLVDLGSIYDAEALKDTMVVNIDNKTDNSKFGDVVIVDPQMSSVSEIVAQIINSLALPIDIDIAQNLMSGILNGTDNFQSPKTSPLAFEMVGILMKNGAVRKQALPQRPTMPTNNPFLDQSFGLDNQADPFGTKLPQPFPRQNEQRNRVPQPQRQQFPRPFPQPNQSAMQQPQAPRMPMQNQMPTQNQNRPVQPMPQPMVQPQQNNNNIQQPDAPADWLTPKVYKGSSTLI